MSTHEVIAAADLGYQYGPEAVVLQDLELQVQSGEWVFVTGPSGVGKTTLMRLLLGSLKPSQGTLEVLGQDIGRLEGGQLQRLRCQIGMVFQEFRLLKGHSAFDNVAVALRLLGIGGSLLRSRTLAALEEVGLDAVAHRPVDRLSWGQQQRVAFARALVRQPALVLADEPTANLDPATTRRLLEVLAGYCQRGTTVVMATHDPEALAYYPGRQIHLDSGEGVGHGH